MKIDEKTFVETVRRLAAENPDYIYSIPDYWDEEDQRYYPGSSCKYIEKDSSGNLSGSCLIGKALVSLGVEPEVISEVEGKDAVQALDLLSTGISGPVARWARDVQGYQDDMVPWGRAISLADENYPGVA